MGGSNFCTVVGVNMKLLEEIGGKLPTTYAEFVELAKLCKANVSNVYQHTVQTLGFGVHVLCQVSSLVQLVI
jgi:ABC-type glycerol-3-phosphate transport system substrate-binding protein